MLPVDVSQYYRRSSEDALVINFRGDGQWENNLMNTGLDDIANYVAYGIKMYLRFR